MVELSRLLPDLRPRSAWGARPPRHPAGDLVPGMVRGLALHWPGDPGTRPIPKAGVAAALRGWQDFHMDGRGWSDIAYQVAVDQWGRIWQLRGLTHRSAANGDVRVNGAYGAVLLILVTGEQPSPAMVAATRRVVAAHRALFPGSAQLVGHRAIRPGGSTACPGPAVLAALAAGDFNPNREDDTMTPEELLAATVKGAGDRHLAVVLAQTWTRAQRIEAAITALAAALGPTVEAAVKAALVGAVVDVDVTVTDHTGTTP